MGTLSTIALFRRVTMRLIAPLLVIAVSILSACGSMTVIQGQAHKQTVELGLPRDVVFDALLTVSHDGGLDVEQSDKSAGVLTFEPLKVKAADMDRYCRFPAMDEDGNAVSTFMEHHGKLMAEGNPGLDCRNETDVLIEEIDEDSCRLKLKTGWFATKDGKEYACDSLGVWEDALIRSLESALLAPKK